MEMSTGVGQGLRSARPQGAYGVPPVSLLPAPSGDERVIYLTFDDGPYAPWTEQILDVLAEYDAHATFFVIGRQVAGHPDLMRRMYEEGHGIANHSWSHTPFGGMSRDSFNWEIERTANAIGANESKCIRPPYGNHDENTVNFAADLGYTLAMWDVDPQDWRLPGAEAIANNVFANLASQRVVLMHDGGGDRSQTVAALRMILETLTAQGYVFKAICREAPMPDIKGAPWPDGDPGQQPLLAASGKVVALSLPTDAESVKTAGESAGDGMDVVQGEILLPVVGATVAGTRSIVGRASGPEFAKWQLDLLISEGGEAFLAVGDAPQPEPVPMYEWDTTLYPNGDYVVRLRVVTTDGNYQEYFSSVTVRN